MNKDTYRLTFPDGSPVKVGELQKWLDEIIQDPMTSPDEIAVAEGIVKGIRAKLS